MPELTNLLGFRGAAILSGFVWALWHRPGTLWAGYSVRDTPKAYQLAWFTAMVVTSGVIFAWLRMKSGSIWPAVIMHSLHNALIQSFFDHLTLDKAHTHYFTSEFGIATVPFTALLAWYCLRNAGIGEKPTRESASFHA